MEVYKDDTEQRDSMILITILMAWILGVGMGMFFFWILIK